MSKIQLRTSLIAMRLLAVGVALGLCSCQANKSTNPTFREQAESLEMVFLEAVATVDRIYFYSPPEEAIGALTGFVGTFTVYFDESFFDPANTLTPYSDLLRMLGVRYGRLALLFESKGDAVHSDHNYALAMKYLNGAVVSAGESSGFMRSEKEVFQFIQQVNAGDKYTLEHSSVGTPHDPVISSNQDK